jgi:hypothetical protein
VPRWRSIAVSRWSRLLLSAALLAFLLRQMEIAPLRAAFARADVAWLLLAWATLVASQVVSAYRWALLARAVGFSEPLGRFCLYYFSGMYLNLFAPGTVAGDVGRVLFLAGEQRRALALSTVVAHRAIGFVALLWIAALAAVLLPDAPLHESLRWLAALSGPATIGGWLWGPRLMARLLPRTNRWRLLVERDLAPYWHDHALLAVSLGWAAAMHALQLAGQVLVARGLGLHLPWAFFLVVVPLINIAGTLPLSLRGIGLREVGYWYYLAGIGVPREPAVAFGILVSAVLFAADLSGLPAFVMLRPRRIPHRGERTSTPGR